MKLRHLFIPLLTFTTLLFTAPAPADGPPPNSTVSDDSTGNTAEGSRALGSKTTGVVNTAFGYGALRIRNSMTS
jgi:hypothetical protein